VKEKGELDKELGPLYLNYGKCLLRCAQQDLDVLGGISLEHNTNNPLVPAARKVFMLNTYVIYSFLATGKVIETGAVGSDSDDEENDENNVNEAAETLELAWQILETARLILADNPQSLSEVYFLLGDLSMESGIPVIVNAAYSVLLSLLQTTCNKQLQIMKSVLNCENPCIQPIIGYSLKRTSCLLSANCGNCIHSHQYQNHIEPALHHYKLASKILQSKIAELNETSPTAEDTQAEIKDIKEVLVELDAKVTPSIHNT
jgi:hypothetical protein